MSTDQSTSLTPDSPSATRPMRLHAVPDDREAVLVELLRTIEAQLPAAESRELFHLGLDDARLFAAGVLSAYAEGRLELDVACRRAAIRLLREE